MRKLKDYNPFLKALLQTLCKRTHFESSPKLSEILKAERLVVAMSHATPLSWIPAMSMLSIETENAGGGDRLPFGVVDRWMFSNPLTRSIAEYVGRADGTHHARRYGVPVPVAVEIFDGRWPNLGQSFYSSCQIQ